VKKEASLIVSLLGFAIVSSAPVLAQDTPAPANPSTNAQVAAPATTTNSSNAPAAGPRRRRVADLGPVPEIHAPVPNTLPGLLGKPLKWKSTGILVAPQNDATHYLYSVKDPTIFRYENKWEVYATAYMVSGPAAAELQNPGTNEPAQGRRRGAGGTFTHSRRSRRFIARATRRTIRCPGRRRSRFLRRARPCRICRLISTSSGMANSCICFSRATTGICTGAARLTRISRRVSARR
jgi:hypothetical protein